MISRRGYKMEKIMSTLHYFLVLIEVNTTKSKFERQKKFHENDFRSSVNLIS